MKKTYIFIMLLITITLFLLGGCDKKDTVNSSDKLVQKTFLLQSGRYIYGDASSLFNRETININTKDKSITYSSFPLSSYMTFGKYTNSDVNDYTFIDETGNEQSFTVEENALSYEDKRFIYEYNQFDKCTMEIVDGTITSTGLTVQFTSRNENETFYGSYYRVEKFENSEWNEVQQNKIQGELAWTDEAFSVPKDGFSDWVIDWNWLYGDLTYGQYRVIKDILDFRGTGDFDEYYLAAEFRIDK
ncbi:MAG: hypothetical protein K0R15_2950 [Clostridiales bacterium]|jgi:hypothetical protein|nr:hypothetical protein [Clostridiales bacterium]